MKNIIKFIIFIIYTILIFILNDIKILICLLLLNFIITILLKIRLKNMFYHLKILLPFIIFTMGINIFLAGLYDGIIMGIRIFICYHITYIFSKTYTFLELADMIQKLCYPLKIFKINTNHIGIMVSISMCMIPVLKNEISTRMQAIKSKGKPLKMNNIIILMKPILISILTRTNQMEKTLISKAYSDDRSELYGENC